MLSDLDRDGDLDLYVANDTNPNRLYENVPWPGGAAADPAGLGFRFEERAARRGWPTRRGMGVAGGDYDGDGRADLFVTNARRQVHGAYRSKPPDANEPSFERRARRRSAPTWAGRRVGVTWGDLDLDTDLDLVLVNGSVPVADLGGMPSTSQRLRQPRTRRRAGASTTSAAGCCDTRAGAGARERRGGLTTTTATRRRGGSIGGSARAAREHRRRRATGSRCELDDFRPGAPVTVELPERHGPRP